MANITVPLTDDEKDFLVAVYKKRRWFLATVYMTMLAVGIFICVFAFGMDTLRNQSVPKDDTRYASTLGIRAINLFFIIFILLVSGIYFYLKKVLPFKRDADSGVKEKVEYVIVKKEYFSHTGKYYIAFNDPDYLHHETDMETWNNCDEGDGFPIYRAIRSKFVFEDSGRYRLI